MLLKSVMIVIFSFTIVLLIHSQITTSDFSLLPVDKTELLNVIVDSEIVYLEENEINKEYQKDGVIDLDYDESSRYFLMNSAIGLKGGAAYYHNILLGGHIFEYGFSDRFSVSVGTEIFSLLAGYCPLLIVIPRLNIPVIEDQLYFGVASYSGLPLSSKDFFSYFLGLLTVGNKNSNMTIGVGYAYLDKEFSHEPIFQVGGKIKIARRYRIVSDNFIVRNFDSRSVYSTLFLRYKINKISLDIGLGTEFTDGPIIPILGGSFQF